MGFVSMDGMNKRAEKVDSLHPRNPHRGRYDFVQLCAACPELEAYLRANPAGDRTIDFSHAAAVLCLNRALLAHFYGVRHWMIPAGYLCPPIPGRADYIHCLADLLAGSNAGEVPKGKRVKILDVGTGANCIYPIIGSQSYGWRFVGSDVDPVSVKTARLIVESNPCLTKMIRVVEQRDACSVFRGIIRAGERYEATLCNPPFHASMEDAQAGSARKVRNLSRGQSASRGAKGASAETGAGAKLNFGGQNSELWCAGGELAFIGKMIRESVDFAGQVGWFTSLVSKSAHLRVLQQELDRCGAAQVTVLPMGQGNKVSRVLAWRF